MQNCTTYLKQKHFPITRSILEEEYKKKRNELPEEEFNRRYMTRVEDFDYHTTYHEIIADNPTEPEFTLFLLDRILEQQRATAKKTRIIAGILIFWLICNIITGIIMAVTLSNLL